MPNPQLAGAVLALEPAEPVRTRRSRLLLWMELPECRAFIHYRNRPGARGPFIRNSDGSLDGGVHGLYTIAGRTDAPGCRLAQPNFAAQLAFNNVIFRIPTPIFGSAW